MQVQETVSEGLRREYRVVVPAAELETKLDAKLDQLKGQVRINGFRPGKVPAAHLKKLYGRSAMAEAIDTTVNETNQKIVADNSFRMATEPKVTLPTEEAVVAEVIDGKRDLDYTVAFEILPKIEIADVRGVQLEKQVAAVADGEIDEALDRLTAQQKPYLPKGEGAKAAEGDRVQVSFVGTIDGKPFEGGTADDIAVDIGSNTFIPGFEPQLVGIGEGETRTLNVTFPENYGNTELAGKAAAFEVTAKAVQAPGTLVVDDEFAKQLGMESLAKLREAIKERIKREHDGASRSKIKRALLDALDEKHKFELPPTLVEDEFNNVWNTVTNDLKQQGRTFEQEDTTEEKARDEYRKLAERRVRLGLVLAEIGDKQKIQVSDEEVSRAVVDRARQFPGQEQQVWDYYRKNPQALATLRAPIFEEKVVDYLLELATVTEKEVSKEELFKVDEDEA
ncbi:trigger factor [Variibacter gotjawalensis]|uniref:Trigger factor n=1 Tax=Variibacter gotjawalensis TaxID=1333996 RepID=A0A0S3PX34_9BRAD|nr:trigger factor [Variibacter gotjawalensis]NIK46338.1 trigger factor [Variibacter gotjawalensis]RZS48248.1 trigger factor [Variibacter gotjawalensis]BAT60508.1 trigger factor [Variibacter gotjawalensis]